MNILKNKKGFTVIEVIVVLAIIVVISSIVAPTLLQSSEIATLKSDIQSAKVIENALAFYTESTRKPIADNDSFEEALNQLVESKYLKDGSTKPQTKDAKWVYDVNQEIVCIGINTDDEEKYDNYKDLLSDDDQKYVVTVSSP